MGSGNTIKPGLTDKSAFEHLFRSQYARLTTIASNITGERSVAEDIVQDVFAGLWQKGLGQTIQSSAEAYLLKAVRNNSIQYVQRRKEPSTLSGNEMVAQSGNTYISLDYKDIAKRIQTTINRLPARAAEAFVMNRFEGMTYAQIAESMAVSVKTVEADMGLALREFRLALGIYL